MRIGPDFRHLRGFGLAIVLAVLPLAACSGLRPVYGPEAVSTQGVAVSYAAPQNRLEQVIYQDLALRLGRPVPGAPKLTVTTSSSESDLTLRDIKTANYQHQMKVTAGIKLVDAQGKVLFSGTRSATADFTRDRQIAPGEQAAADAAERAAHILADNIRLTVLGVLAP